MTGPVKQGGGGGGGGGWRTDEGRKKEGSGHERRT